MYFSPFPEKSNFSFKLNEGMERGKLTEAEEYLVGNKLSPRYEDFFFMIDQMRKGKTLAKVQEHTITIQSGQSTELWRTQKLVTL